MLSRADDPEGVRIAVDGVHDYREMMDQTGMGGGGGGIGNQSGGMGGDEGKSLEDLFYQKEMELSKLAFTYQFSHAVVYAWVKLREQVSFISLETVCLERCADFSLSDYRRYGTSPGSPSALRRARRIALEITSRCSRHGIVWEGSMAFCREG